MNRPDSGSVYTAHCTPPVTATTKQSRMQPLNRASTACHRNVFNSHAPRNRPAARSRKKTRYGVRRQRRGVARISRQQRRHPDVHGRLDADVEKRCRREREDVGILHRRDGPADAARGRRSRGLRILDQRRDDDQDRAHGARQQVEPRPRQPRLEQPCEDGGPDDRADAEEPFEHVHDRRVLGRRRGEVADERERAGLEDADRDP